jgi:hypothetical protein
VLTVATRPGPATESQALRAVEPGDGGFVRNYVTTLLPMLAGLALLWAVFGAVGAGQDWLPAGGASAGWAVAVAAWLHRRGWATGTASAVAFAAPAVVVVTSALVGWLSPGGLVLAAPLTTVLAAALGMLAEPRRTAV